MKRFLILLILPLFAACTSIPAIHVDTPRERLLAAESAFAVAVQGALAAYKAGVIKPESDVDKAVDTAIKSGYAALVVWRTNPDSPDYMRAALAAMQPLLDLVAGIKAQKQAAVGGAGSVSREAAYARAIPRAPAGAYGPAIYTAGAAHV